MAGSRISMAFMLTPIPVALPPILKLFLSLSPQKHNDHFCQVEVSLVLKIAKHVRHWAKNGRDARKREQSGMFAAWHLSLTTIDFCGFVLVCPLSVTRE